jgi:signal transduction histidine kinase
VNSIRRQLTRELLIAVLLLLGGGLAALYFAAREAAIEQFDDALRAKALAITTMTERSRDRVRLDFSDRFFRGFDDDEADDFFMLWDNADRVVARSESLGDDGVLPLIVGSLEKPRRWNLQLPSGDSGRAIGFRFTPRGGPRGEEAHVKLVVATERDELDETLWTLFGISSGAAVLLVAATLSIVPRVLRRGLRPLDALGAEVNKIDAGSLAARLPVQSHPAELQPIVARLNDLLARLESSFERERRFSADLAHELRTPLAELRTTAECSLKWPETRDPATDREVLAIATHMERIVAHILALARSEEGRATVVIDTVPLDVLVREVWRTYEPRAAERGQRVSLELEPAAAPADAALLRAILANLCDNAIEYAPAGGEVALRVAGGPGGPVIQIVNTTVGLAAKDIPRLFDRFWRKEAARTAGVHLGLGLSLARAFATAMEWSLTAELDAAQRIVFTLRPARTA